MELVEIELQVGIVGASDYDVFEVLQLVDPTYVVIPRPTQSDPGVDLKANDEDDDWNLDASETAELLHAGCLLDCQLVDDFVRETLQGEDKTGYDRV